MLLVFEKVKFVHKVQPELWQASGQLEDQLAPPLGAAGRLIREASDVTVSLNDLLSSLQPRLLGEAYAQCEIGMAAEIKGDLVVHVSIRRAAG